MVANTADEEALALLRQEARSYHVESTGETYLAPPALPLPALTPPRRINPFASRASRICRYLLLHPSETFMLSALASATEVNKGFTSEVISALAAEALVTVEGDPGDARARLIRLADATRLLDEWRRVWQRRRPAAQRFDLGTRTVDETLRALKDARDVEVPWAISGLAGASFVRKAVEPADVLLLTTAEGAKEWPRALLADPSPDRGLLRIAVMPDPFVFGLARLDGRLRIADPVQLWLDTATAGERAAAAAAAIAETMRW